MKKVLSVVMALAMMLTSVFSVVTIPTAAAATNPVEFTVSSPTGAVGDIITVDVAVSENSYLVNGDFKLLYDPSVLELQQGYFPDPDDDTATVDADVNYDLFNGYMVMTYLYTPGEFRAYFVSMSDKPGITAGGRYITVAFKVLTNNVGSTQLRIESDPLASSTTGKTEDTVENTPFTVTGGVVSIEGGYDRWNFMQEDFIVGGREYLTVNADGSWTIKGGELQLRPDFTFDYNEYQYIAQWLESTGDVMIGIYDISPTGEYGNNRINLYSQWAGPSYYPAGTYKATNIMKGDYDWSLANAGWGIKGTATFKSV